MWASAVGFAANRHNSTTILSNVKLYIYQCVVLEEEKPPMRVSNPKAKPNPRKNKMSMELAWCNICPTFYGKKHCLHTTQDI